MCLLGMWGVTPPILLKLQASLSKVGHAALDMVTVCSVIISISNSILLLIIVGQIDKTPPTQGKCLATSLLGGS